MKSIWAAHVPLPFYLRLPDRHVFLVHDPDTGVSALMGHRRMGEISFREGWNTPHGPLPPESVIDGYQPPPPTEFPEQQHFMTCVLADGREIPSLFLRTGPNPAFSEMRPYSEAILFLLAADTPDSATLVRRAFCRLNHFLDVYRAVTQDPYVHQLDPELDVTIVGFARAVLPAGMETLAAAEALARIPELRFESGNVFRYRLNTFEDLWPGPVLEQEFLSGIAQFASRPYELPLHHELIFKAQEELKARHFHIAILEAETAFEVYVARTLIELGVHLGHPRASVVSDMEYPNTLHHLNARLRRLDAWIQEHRRREGLPSAPDFAGSPEHDDWKKLLYSPRHQVVHAGRRDLTFDEVKAGIAAGKKAIHSIDAKLGTLSPPLGIYPGVDHLNNTAGRLRW